MVGCTNQRADVGTKHLPDPAAQAQAHEIVVSAAEIVELGSPRTGEFVDACMSERAQLVSVRAEGFNQSETVASVPVNFVRTEPLEAAEIVDLDAAKSTPVVAEFFDASRKQAPQILDEEQALPVSTRPAGFDRNTTAAVTPDSSLRAPAHEDAAAEIVNLDRASGEFLDPNAGH